MVKLSRLAKIRKNRESFPPRMFQRIRYRVIYEFLSICENWIESVRNKFDEILRMLTCMVYRITIIEACDKLKPVKVLRSLNRTKNWLLL